MDQNAPLFLHRPAQRTLGQQTLSKYKPTSERIQSTLHVQENAHADRVYKQGPKTYTEVPRTGFEEVIHMSWVGVFSRGRMYVRFLSESVDRECEWADIEW